MVIEDMSNSMRLGHHDMEEAAEMKGLEDSDAFVILEGNLLISTSVSG